MYAKVARFNLRQWFSSQAYSGAHPGRQYAGRLGEVIYDQQADRKFKFVQIINGGITGRAGMPLCYRSAGGGNIVTPDLAGEAMSAGHVSQVFAGICLASTPLIPASGSTTFGWIMTNGRLGNQGGLLGSHNLRTFVINGSVADGLIFTVSTRTSTFISYNSSMEKMSACAERSAQPLLQLWAGVAGNGTAIGTNALTSVAQGYIRSPWS